MPKPNTDAAKRARKLWYAKNRDLQLARVRKWYIRNKAKVAAYMAEKYANDPAFRARALANARKWQSEHPGYSQKYRETRRRDYEKYKAFYEANKPQEDLSNESETR